MSDIQSSVIITGASKGIGRRIAQAFARSDKEYALLLIARNKEKLRETRRICLNEGAKNVEIEACDLSKETEVQSIVWPESMPEPAILINNAGHFLHKSLEHTTASEFQQQFSSNVMTAFNSTQRFLPILKKQPQARIVNICSVGALEGKPESGAYSSAKHGLLGYTRSLRAELLDTKVAVTAINLGQTYSTSWEGIQVDPAKLIDPDDVASIVLQLSTLSQRTVVEEITLRPQHGDIPPSN